MMSKLDQSRSEGSSIITETLEYNGKLEKKIYLGGGAEAKVYLVQLDELDEIVALK